MSAQVTSTPEKHEFLREHMLRKFCLKWQSFGRNVDRFGTDVVLNDYAQELAGRGYKAAHIVKGIDSALKLTICPDPKAFLELVISVNKTDKQKREEKDPFKYTMEDRVRHRAMMKVVRGKTGDIRELIKRTAPDLGHNNPNARQIISSYIDSVATTIKEGSV